MIHTPTMNPIIGGGTTLKNGLQSLWEFDEPSGVTAFDAHGTNDGTNNNATVNQSGRINKSYLYDDAIPSYVSMGDVLNFDVADPFSASVWFTRDSTDNLHTLVSKMESSGNFRGYLFWIRLSATALKPNALNVTIRNQNTTTQRLITYGTTQITDTDWHHGVFTYDGSKTEVGIKIYLDGVLEPLSYQGDTISFTTVNAAPFCIGARNAATHFHSGHIDQTGVWNRVLTAGEILTLNNSMNGLAHVNW